MPAAEASVLSDQVTGRQLPGRGHSRAPPVGQAQGDRQGGAHSDQSNTVGQDLLGVSSCRVMPPVSISGMELVGGQIRGQLQKVGFACLRAAVGRASRHRRALVAAAGQLHHMTPSGSSIAITRCASSASNPPRWKSAEFSFTATVNDGATVERMARTTSSSILARFSTIRQPVGAPVGQRRKEPRQQVAVRRMDLDTVEPARSAWAAAAVNRSTVASICSGVIATGRPNRLLCLPRSRLTRVPTRRPACRPAPGARDG